MLLHIQSALSERIQINKYMFPGGYGPILARLDCGTGGEDLPSLYHMRPAPLPGCVFYAATLHVLPGSRLRCCRLVHLRIFVLAKLEANPVNRGSATNLASRLRCRRLKYLDTG